MGVPEIKDLIGQPAREGASPDSPTPQDHHIIKGQLFRRRGSRVHVTTDQPPPPKPEPVRRPAKVDADARSRAPTAGRD